jgi:proteasome lid subunit RPN8/RPN11
MIEAGVIINTSGEPIHWHEPRHSSGAIPDSRTLWDVIWKAHVDGWLRGVAHSHPGSGVPRPSQEDLSTFVAIESALGRPLSWWITSSDRTVICQRSTMDSVPGRVIYGIRELVDVQGRPDEPQWVDELRRRSEVYAPYR